MVGKLLYKHIFMQSLCACLFLLLGTVSVAAADRLAWSSVPAPEIVSVQPDESDGRVIVVSFNLETSSDGADKAVVEMFDAAGNIMDKKTVGRSRKVLKTAKFEPGNSGVYSFRVSAVRNEEAVPLYSQPVSVTFSYPLASPDVSVRNTGGGDIEVTWNSIHEADSYLITCTEQAGGRQVEKRTVPATGGLSAVISGLTDGKKYTVAVAACRGSEQIVTSVTKTVHLTADRIWQFTWFGQSTNGSRNTMEMLDSDNLTFKLSSCTYNPESLVISDKGGKFTTFHDGLSFYYTVIDPETENFELTATFTVDYINNPADGQEGFGLLALDSLGEHGVSMTNHYTNSAGIIATKFEETIAGSKKTSKDTLGARFVSGITPEILAAGESAIAENGKNVSHAFSYDQSDLVRNGDVYRITLKKTNTGYHAVYDRMYATDEMVTEYIMYGPEKLQQLDKDHVYVGFAVARGCNVTVSDVVFTVSDPKNDPPAQEEPPELVPLTAKVDSPTSYYKTKYPFVFAANADGLITVTDSDGRNVLENKKVTALKDFTANLKLERGVNDFIVTFTPDEDFVPGEKQALAWYDTELKIYRQGARPVSIMHSVICNTYTGKELYVAPDGDAFGKGTKESPLDLFTAVSYVKPGQTIVLAGGIYYQNRALIIERGNSGTFFFRKKMISAPGERAVLDFSNAGGGVQLWGDRWLIENIDIRRTDGNIKGLQIAGDKNIVRGVNTYECGDTGCQISGVSTESFEKWPSDNLIENCSSWANCDPAENNADGFAAKLTCGNGNIFRGCISYNNIDDGWDLYAKADTGPIGAVLIENCVAYQNGSLPDGSGNGDGNGFKLGGDGIAVAHKLKNSAAWNNGAAGITSNSNPAVILENVTSFANEGRNITLYGKGENTPRLFKASGVISMDGAESDNFEQPELVSENNYFWTGATSENSNGETLGKEIFVSVDMSIVPEQGRDGSIDMKSLLELNSAAPKASGARLK